MSGVCYIVLQFQYKQVLNKTSPGAKFTINIKAQQYIDLLNRTRKIKFIQVCL